MPFQCYALRQSADKEGNSGMSVIGRLDDQVNEIIIKPVGSRHGQESEDSETPAQERAQASAHVVKEKRAYNEEAAKSDKPSELPVWML